MNGPPQVPQFMRNINMQQQGMGFLNNQQIENTMKQIVRPQPSTKVKNINWEPIMPAQLTNTIWSSIDESDVKLEKEDFQLLDQAFAKQVRQSKPVNETKKDEKKTIISGAERQNAEIIVKNIKIDMKLALKAILNCNMEIINIKRAEILNCLSYDKLKPMLNSYCGNKDELEDMDVFLYDLMKIPRIKERITCMKQFSILEEMLQEQQQVIQNTIEGWIQIRECKKFQEVMKWILAIGNYLNQDNRRLQNAKGLKITALNMIINTKIGGEYNTLLGFVTKRCQDNKLFESITIQKQQEFLQRITLISKSSLKDLKDDLINNFKQVKEDIDNAVKSQTKNPEDKVCEIFGGFNNKVQKLYDGCVNLLADSEKEYEKTLSVFKERPPKEGSHTFANKIYDFWINYFKEARDQLAKEQLKQKKQEQMKKQFHKKSQSSSSVQMASKKDLRKSQIQTSDLRKTQIQDVKDLSVDNNVQTCQSSIDVLKNGSKQDIMQQMFMRRNKKLKNIEVQNKSKQIKERDEQFFVDG